jgi:hypothetical protein
LRIISNQPLFKKLTISIIGIMRLFNISDKDNSYKKNPKVGPKLGLNFNF